MNYWDSNNLNCGYGSQELINHHSEQNKIITDDLLLILNNKHIIRQPFENTIDLKNLNILKDIIIKSKKIIEFGCGTGELLYELYKLYDKKKYLGIDITDKCINFANEKYKNNNLSYLKFNCLNEDITTLGKYNLSICSNCLEHFKNPYILIDEMKKVSNYALILVPYNQNPMTDGYYEEGGAGHVFKFDEDSFKNYNIISDFKFYTHGWSCGINPLQWCVLIKF